MSVPPNFKVTFTSKTLENFGVTTWEKTNSVVYPFGSAFSRGLNIAIRMISPEVSFLKS